MGDFMDNKYFLAANSADGFYSVFDKCYSAADNWHAYIIKGGPGTGKSSLMRKLAEAAKRQQIPYELCPCSSDPDSLDAVIFPTLRKVIMDGTAPHTVDPKFPAVCEEIVNMGAFWDADKISKKRDEVISLTLKNSAFHKLAAQYIKAAGQVTKNNFSFALSATDIEKCVGFSVKTAEKNLPAKNAVGKKWTRFLGGITPKGEIYYTDTINSFDKKILINDTFGAAASVILSALSDMAVSRGYEIVLIKNALLPNDITDAVLIPELCLAFCREYGGVKYDSDIRRIHFNRFTDMARLNKSKQKIMFNKKLAHRLLEGATETLAAAKQTHDELESHYIAAMNFDKMKEFCDKFTEEFF